MIDYKYSDIAIESKTKTNKKQTNKKKQTKLQE
jgi:hypothetical protein